MTLPFALAATFTVVALGGALFLRRRESISVPFPWWWLAAITGCAAASVLLRDTTSTADALKGVVAVLIASTPAVVLGAGPFAAWWLRRTTRAAGVTLPHPLPLHAPGLIRSIVLDKHRTLTTGDMHVADVQPLDPDHRTNLLFFAGAIARGCQTPFASALSARSRGARVSSVREMGAGRLSGSVDRHPVRLGPPEWIGLTSPQGRGVALGVEVDLRALGTIRLEDTLRNEAPQEAATLAAFGPITLVSDDSASNTASLCEDVGLNNYLGEADATVRLEQVTKGRIDGGRVVMIGTHNPLNAEALALADIALTSATDSQLPEGMTALEPFSLSSALHALHTLESARSTIGFARGFAIGVSVLGALATLMGFVAGWGLLATAAFSSAMVPTGVMIVIRRGAQAKTCHVDAKFSPRSQKSPE